MLEPLPTLQNRAPVESPLARHLPARAALDWLAAGWRDLSRAPGSSLAYGAAVLALSWVVLWALAEWNLLYLALPALSGFLIVGPFLAIGLYEKSRRLAEGEPAKALRLALGAAGQIAMAGLLLGLLVLFWLRAADLLYALFFGLQPFPGATEAFENAFTTPRGWALIATGLLVGGLFAAFAFAVSVFSFPMLVSTRHDALTAMGRSFALNPVVIVLWLVFWGWLWGVLGMLLAMPLLVCFKIVLGHSESLRPWAQIIER